ncbi:class I SAM-dependent methyltransferase [Pseudohoeflea suaedae]|uniref:Class I SAM-dependent methyltransferase n=1 Tax=Pseudohoeflea suaedae TaxID=877384 RepID=A0A4R5PN13_9HYPH|nr:class I SAM-dependent methyltransferase [Pseudohoeflea suaedae]TDH38329.1 class I SAM-dependent methyltransferase [Pseudohoeflea suaedae]
MKDDEWDRMRAMYAARLAETGYSPETLGWTKPKHRLRYKILVDYWFGGPDPLDGSASLLDFGCGFGDLAVYCAARGLDVDYHGIDLSEDLVAAGRRVFPHLDLEAGSPIEDGLDRVYDVIVSSGAHNYALTDNEAYIRRTFELFDASSRCGFAINFLSDRVNHRNAGNYYASPAWVLDLALSHSRRVEIRHDYMPFEFTVFVDKRSDFGDLTVFAPFEADCG